MDTNTFAPYKGGKGIRSYRIGEDWIEIVFENEAVYRYTAASCGWVHLNTMKTLARRGSGLTTHINKYVRDSYQRQPVS